MRTVSIQAAKARLSELIRQAAEGEPLVIAEGGKPVVKVTAVESPVPRWLGFLAGQVQVPDDFDHMGATEIRRMFSGDA